MNMGEFVSGFAILQGRTLRAAAQRFGALVSSDAAAAAGAALEASGDEAAGAPPRVTLLIESGLHRGASLELTADEYVIGSGDDCDIVLRDPGIAPRQYRLAREAAAFALSDLHAAKSDEARPRDASPVQPRAVRREDGAIKSSYGVGGVEIALIRHLPPLSAASLSEREPERRSPAWLFSGALAAGLVLTTIALATVHLLAKGAMPGVAERIVAGSQALLAQGFEAVRFRQGSNGELLLAGLVADADEQARLRNWLARSDYGDARSTVQQAAGLVEQVRHSLGGEGLQIDLQGGRLRIEGTTRQLDIKKRIRTLAQELKGALEVEDRVAYIDARQRANSPGPLPVRIRDVMIGSPSYFRTEKGERYFEGALMPDGAEVVAIEPAQIRFRLEEKIVVYPLEG